jgi:hypothetical protein
VFVWLLNVPLLQAPPQYESFEECRHPGTNDMSSKAQQQNSQCCQAVCHKEFSAQINRHKTPYMTNRLQAMCIKEQCEQLLAALLLKTLACLAKTPLQALKC